MGLAMEQAKVGGEQHQDEAGEPGIEPPILGERKVELHGGRAPRATCPLYGPLTMRATR